MTHDPIHESSEEQESWEQIEDVVERGDADALSQVIQSLSPGEVARAISRLDEEDQERVLTLLPPEEAADLLSELPESQAAELLDEMPAETVALIMDEMDSDERVDVLAELEEHEPEDILVRMDPAEAANARRLLAYPEDSAGGLMITEYLAYPQELTVADVLKDMRDNAELYSDYGIQYCYVVANGAVLVGVLRMRDLVLSAWSRPITDVMVPNPQRVRYDMPLEDLEQFFDRYEFLGAPVVDDEDRLIGVVERIAVEEATEERSDRTFMSFTGIVGGEELRQMPLMSRAPRRLSWLVASIFLNVLAAGVIALYQETIEAVIALAVFLPIVSGMSGNSGSQAAAVSIRELTLGLILPRDFLRVIWKEAQVGLINGLVLGLLLGVFAALWQDNVFLGLVVGGALALNTLVSVLLGGLIPLFLRRIGIDPALVSMPLLTISTDVCGFFLVLSFATAALSYL